MDEEAIGQPDYGSSPLARGLRGSPGACRNPPRIIPARAGFTIGVGDWCAAGADHPRSRGVYGEKGRRAISRSGSSPLARGLRWETRIVLKKEWIIPARAGFTTDHDRNRRPGRDHPRSRGVYPVTRATFRSSSGSSPLARGLLRIWDRECYLPGIIPARAGFTPPPRTVSAGSWDHPRSRGVYGPGASRPGPGAGSSPLARGLRVSRGHDDEREGIIPARAGFTDAAVPENYDGWDHPRSRGVYDVYDFCATKQSGSSPLARGLPPDDL